MNHTHDASQIVSGALPIDRGGTGVTSIDDLKSLLSITGQSSTSITIKVSGTSGDSRSYDLSVPAQYCIINDITVGRSSESGLHPISSGIQIYSEIAYYDNGTIPRYCFTYALLEPDGITLKLAVTGYNTTQKNMACVIYY